MSGKLTLDTEAGGSVTITVDDTETGDIEYPLDSAGIDSGSGTNGTYTKFPDGTLINVMPSIDVSDASTYFTFPHVFIDSNYAFSGTAIVPSVVADNLTMSIRDKTRTDSIGIYCVRDGVLGNNAFACIAIGRWK